MQMEKCAQRDEGVAEGERGGQKGGRGEKHAGRKQLNQEHDTRGAIPELLANTAGLTTCYSYFVTR